MKTLFYLSIIMLSLLISSCEKSISEDTLGQEVESIVPKGHYTIHSDNFNKREKQLLKFAGVDLLR